MFKWFCKHNNLTYLGNFFGDEMYKCNLCGKIIIKQLTNKE